MMMMMIFILGPKNTNSYGDNDINFGLDDYFRCFDIVLASSTRRKELSPTTLKEL
jgi:hypothetical protein